jgi:hypothetical protein
MTWSNLVPLSGSLAPANRDERRKAGVVGEAGFEPTISCSQSTRVARLRHSPPDAIGEDGTYHLVVAEDAAIVRPPTMTGMRRFVPARRGATAAGHPMGCR